MNKRTTTREKILHALGRVMGIGTGMSLGLFGVALAAVSLSGTFNTFQSRTPVVADELNRNFTTLRTTINNIPLGTYCGRTSNTMSNLGGYAAVKSLCETACNDTRAHMCTPHEVALSLQKGISMPTSTGLKIAAFTAFSANASEGDCLGWTSSSGGDFISTYSSGVYPLTSDCTSIAPLACCL